MNKLLTISIAAYNVADYIEETLDSLVSSKYINQLEIFVVDDGGQDRTLEIAKEYQERFPQSVIPVHKENGGYGSTVNYSMEHATGKYFKLLDGDDWFDTQALDTFLEKIETISSDVLITPYNRCVEGAGVKTISYGDMFQPGEHQLNELYLNRPIGMWAMAYRTEVLKKSKLVLPEKIFYTDIYYSTMPFSEVDTIQFLDLPLYQYRIGRDGQSVSKESRIKNMAMMVSICKDIIQFVSNQKNNNNIAYLNMRALTIYNGTIKTFMLLPINRKNATALKEFDDSIKELSPDLYHLFVKHPTVKKVGFFINMCRKTNYFIYPIIKLIYPNGIPTF